MKRVPLLPAALVAWAVAIVVVQSSELAAPIAIALWAVAVVAVVILAFVRRARCAELILCTVILACAAAVASHVALAVPARVDAAAFAVDGGRAVDITAVVTSKVAPAASGALWFDAEASLLRAGPRERAVAVPVVISVAPEEVHGADLDLGARIVARGTAQRADAGDRAVLVVFASRGVQVEHAAPGVLGVASGLRSGFVELAADLPGDGGGLLPGLAVGDTSAVGVALDGDMKASSLSHLTAVSGANCAIIVGLVFGAAALIGARRAVRVVAALTALAGFVVLVTPEPSVVRAAAMATAGMLGVLLGRRAAGAASLCLAVVVLLIGDPWLALSLGFALSAAATGALLVLAPPLARGLARFLPRPLALTLAVPLAAQLVCGPLLVLVNPVVPLYGVLANLVAGPAAPAATVLGLAACLAEPIAPVLAAGIAGIAWVPSSWIAATASTVADLPASSVAWPDGWWGVAALAGLGACIVVLVVPARTGTALRRRATGMGGLRIAAGAVVAAVVGAGLGSAALAGPVGALTVPATWSIAACDVGQGDAVLVRSAGRTALIDTGPAAEPLEACLSRLGISRLDLVVLTHFDIDHVGGAAAITGRADVVVHGPWDAAADGALLARLRAGGARVVAAEAGMEGMLGDARWRVLWPTRDAAAYVAGNDTSAVVEFRGGGVPASLFLGDLSASPQAALVGTGRLRPPYDVVKVAHHGSADQDPGLYRMLHAVVAVIGVGADNDYGHPRRELLDLVTAAGAVVARTDQDGLILLSTGDGAVTLWRERAPP